MFLHILGGKKLALLQNKVKNLPEALSFMRIWHNSVPYLAEKENNQWFSHVDNIPSKATKKKEANYLKKLCPYRVVHSILLHSLKIVLSTPNCTIHGGTEKKTCNLNVPYIIIGWKGHKPPIFRYLMEQLGHILKHKSHVVYLIFFW